MENKKLKTIVVLPAYNAEKTLVKTVEEIPKFLVDEIILVDDFSKDGTYNLAKSLGLCVFSHQSNRGYGANQKTCYSAALSKRADIIVMLHPDYQYDPKLIKYFINLLEEDYFDIMLGSRIRSRKESLAGGMPAYKYFSNRFLTFFENLATGYNLSEWHTGMRVYKREVLEKIDFMKNSDDFVFDSQMLLKAIAQGFRIGEISVPVRYSSESSSINFKRSMRYGLHTLWLSFGYLIKNLFCWLKRVI